MEIRVTTRKVLVVVLSIQLTLLGSIGFDKIGMSIPLVRQVVGFIYLIFVPGFLLLRILKIRVSVLEALLFSIGLSISFVMFVGFIINGLYPFVGIKRPISEVPLLVTFSVGVLFLCIFFYLRNRNYSVSFGIYLSKIMVPWTLFFALLPFMAIFGTYLLNFYNNNNIIIFLIAIISVIPLLVALGKIPKEIYPIVILITPFILLSYNNLVGNYIRPTDAVFEFYFAKLVIKNGFWNKTISGPLNGMLSVVILPPLFSKILGISLTWVYKIIAPLLSLFIPLGLYQIYEKKWNEKIAFFASFLFFSMFTFYTWCAVTMKMLFAGMFLTLLMLTITSKEINYINKKIIFVMFCLSLITSHYGTSYIFMFSLFVSVTILYLFKVLRLSTEKCLVTPIVVIFYGASTLVWYMHTSAVYSLNAAIGYLSHIIKSIQELTLPSTTETLIFGEWSITIEILKLLYLIVTFFMLAGLIFESYKTKRIDEYSSLSFPFLGTLIFTYLAGLYAGRIWFIVSILLAPYCIKGILDILSLLTKIKKFKSISSINKKDCNFNKINKLCYIYISIFLLIFLLFNSGFSEIIFKDYGPSIYLSKPRIQKQGDIVEKERFFRKYITDYDVFSAKWLSRYRSAVANVYCDIRGGDVLIPYGDIPPSYYHILTNHIVNILKPSYVYLRYKNVVVGVMGMYGYPYFPLSTFYNSKIYYILLKRGNKIYSNGGSDIYYF